MENELDLDPLSLPRVRRVPIRFGGGHVNPSDVVAEHYQLIDKILVEITERYSTKDSDNGLAEIYKLCKIFKDGIVPPSISNYPEINKLSLCTQLKAFIHKTNARSVHKAKEALR